MILRQKFYFIVSVMFSLFLTYLITEAQEEDDCFCQLQGKIDDCTCNIDTVDHFNNIKIYPRLRSILNKNYFRFYRVNLKRKCPFWSEDDNCVIRHCSVETCQLADVPEGLHILQSNDIAKMYTEQECGDEYDSKLSFLDTTLTSKIQTDIELWRAHDDAQENFCESIEDAESEYFDLLLNPERYTGYRGRSSHRIWNSIYMENCFSTNNLLSTLCLEERVFNRAISGLHSSINIHLCAKYLLSEGSLAKPDGKWGRNLKEFQRRFSKEEGSQWLRNLYFVYLLELRALSKISPHLAQEKFYTGSEVDDWDTQLAVKDLLGVVNDFSYHFNESSMFIGNTQAERLKHEFKQHFRNVSLIMDCVGCDKCKLWGKLQTQGLGTALKILFSSKLENEESQTTSVDTRSFQLQRNEIVALFNSIGRLSTSVYELDEFRQLLKL